MGWLTGILGGAVQETLVTILLGLISVAAGYAVAWVRAKTAALKAQTDNELAWSWLDRLRSIATSSILRAEATGARELRERVKDGKASWSELQAVGERVVQDVLAHLGDQGQEALTALVGDVRDYVADYVEARLEELKLEGTVGTVRDLAAPKSPSPSTSGATSVSA